MEVVVWAGLTLFLNSNEKFTYYTLFVGFLFIFSFFSLQVYEIHNWMKYLKNDVWLKGSLLGFCLLAETQYAFFNYLVFMKHNKYWIGNHKLPQRLLCSWKYVHRNFLGPLKNFQTKYLGIKRLWNFKKTQELTSL